jgi:predicted RNA-binding Zn-ribbon protein involved in translation (DUF1610 family)
MYDYSFRLEPGWRYVGDEALRIDQEVAEKEPCPKCAGRMIYRPWYDLSSHTYIAEAVCIRCGHVIQF